MNNNTARFSLPGLLRAAREIKAQGSPAVFKSAVLYSYFRLFFLGLYGGGGKIVEAAGFKVKYCTVESLLYLFREIFIDQSYWFTAETPRPFIIDCGANIGMASLYFKALYPAAEILAFEPDPDAFACLGENIRLNGLSGIEIKNKALMGAAGETELYASKSGPGSLLVSVLRARADGPARKVPAAKLSEYITRPVDLLKIDIEGAETEALLELRASGRLSMVKRLIMEYHHHIDKAADSLSEILGALESSGFGYQLGGSLERPFHAGQFQNILIYSYNKTSQAMTSGRISRCRNIL